MPRTRFTKKPQPAMAQPVSFGLLREYREQLFTLGVTPTQARILLYLQRHPHSYIKQCARAFGLTGRIVGYPVRMLQRRHLVTKRRAPQDDRYVMLTLTQRGHALARRILRQIDEPLSPVEKKAS